MRVSMVTTVVFSHGKESGPWGQEDHRHGGFGEEPRSVAESVDYRGLDDPAARVEKLIAAAARYLRR